MLISVILKLIMHLSKILIAEQHMLVFYIRGLASDLKFELGYGTKDVTDYQLMMQFWKAVAILEDTYNLQSVFFVT